MILPALIHLVERFRGAGQNAGPVPETDRKEILGTAHLMDFTHGVSMKLSHIKAMQEAGWSFQWPENALMPDTSGDVLTDEPPVRMTGYKASKGDAQKSSLAWYADLCRVMRIDPSHIPMDEVRLPPLRKDGPGGPNPSGP